MPLKKSGKSPSVSLVLAAHSEGLLAHHTVLSITRASEKLAEAKIDFELIVTIDNGRNNTSDYFKKTLLGSNVQIYNVSFADLAAARNFGISKARGAYIATLDADDLISPNWFTEAYRYLETCTTPVVAHTQYSINFGEQDIVWEKFNSRSKEEDALIMTQANRWDSAVMARRDIFEHFPYQPNTHGFGSEDWHFNSQTLAAGIPHRVVPKTVLFVRRKDVSEMTIQAQSRRTVHYTDLLDFSFIRQINIDNIVKHPVVLTRPNRASHFPGKRTMRRAAKALYVSAQGIPFVSDVSRRLVRQLRAPSANGRLPVWLIKEWRAVHEIEKQLFPSTSLLNTIPIYHSEMYELGIFYQQLVASTRNRPDYIIFVPYLTKGGADLVAIKYANTLSRLYPKKYIAVVATEDNASPWQNKLGSDIDFIPFGSLAGNLPENAKLSVLARFIVQSRAKSLHIIQSGLAFKFVAQYRTLLTENNYKVYASAFCEDTDNEGRISGHVHSGLPYAYNSLTKILTDNDSITKQLVTQYGFDSTKFSTHYQPFIDKPLWKPLRNGPLRLLWAGRIAKQKRPDILVEVAAKLGENLFHIDVYGSFQDGYDRTIFNGLDSLSYKGTFDGLDSLPIQDYDAFLYTSENDGMPNIILEIAAFGLPIIAPDVGGIGEFIHDKATGILVAPNNATAYAKALNQLIDQPQLLETISGGALKLLATQHSLAQFEACLRNDLDLH